MKIKEITKMGWLGLLLLLPSCEKDVLGSDTGIGVPIEFSMSSAGYDEGDEVRSFGVMKPETVVVPLGEDDLYLYATLKEEPAEALRVEVGLQPNQKVRLAAYKGTDQQGTTLTYTYSGGQLTHDGAVPLKVEPDGSTYRFVAYSSYSAPTTAITGLTNINPSNDLVWGSKDQPVTAEEASRKVSIKMTHKFARVQVKIDASTMATAITDIGTVTVTGGKTANLTEETGDVAPTSTNANQTVGFPSSTSNVRTSNYCTYWQAVTGVTIASITLTTTAAGSKTFADLRLAFSKTLEAGKSYTLEVNVAKRLVFAGSNIYWDEGNSRMTFDESTNSNYQGVFFKWGSLVGISPEEEANFGDTRLYIPNVSAGTWDRTKTVDSGVWGGTSDDGKWLAIPYVSSAQSTSMDENYLYDHADFNNYKGDICAYLTGKPGIPAGNWRMPNAGEFGLLTYGTWVNGSASGLNAEGTGTITAGWNFGNNGGFFPAAGYRNMSNVPMLGTHGFYDSGTAHTTSSNQRYSFFFMNVGMNSHVQYNVACHSVRCLKI
jgi:hypothetical protein